MVFGTLAGCLAWHEISSTEESSLQYERRRTLAGKPEGEYLEKPCQQVSQAEI